MMFKIRGKQYKQLNQAIKEAGILVNDEVASSVEVTGLGLYSAVLNKQFKTEKQARDFIKKYTGKIELDVIAPELKVKEKD